MKDHTGGDLTTSKCSQLECPSNYPMRALLTQMIQLNDTNKMIIAQCESHVPGLSFRYQIGCRPWMTTIPGPRSGYHQSGW